MGVLVPVPCGRSKDGERQIARTALGSNSSESIANACFLPFPGSKAFGLSALALNSGKPRRTAGSRGIHRPKITRNQLNGEFSVNGLAELTKMPCANSSHSRQAA